MSYSFSVKAISKAEAIDQIVAQLDQVVISQPIHKQDRTEVIATASAFISLLGEPKENESVVVSINGSVGTNGSESAELLHANVSIQTSIQRT